MKKAKKVGRPMGEPKYSLLINIPVTIYNLMMKSIIKKDITTTQWIIEAIQMRLETERKKE